MLYNLVIFFILIGNMLWNPLANLHISLCSIKNDHFEKKQSYKRLLKTKSKFTPKRTK